MSSGLRNFFLKNAFLMIFTNQTTILRRFFEADTPIPTGYAAI